MKINENVDALVVRNELKTTNPREGTGPSPTRNISLPNLNETPCTGWCGLRWRGGDRRLDAVGRDAGGGDRRHPEAGGRREEPGRARGAHAAQKTLALSRRVIRFRRDQIS